MFRFLIPAVALVVLGGLLFGDSGTAAFAGLAFGKVLVAVLIVSVLSKLFWFGRHARFGPRSWGWEADQRSEPRWRNPHRRGHGGRWQPSGESASTDGRRDRDAELFEAWHRMAHAKEEVAGWTEEME